jgi:Domain of unknown function (DUF4434)/Secretion system C-terminal sorting domain
MKDSLLLAFLFIAKIALAQNPSKYIERFNYMPTSSISSCYTDVVFGGNFVNRTIINDITDKIEGNASYKIDYTFNSTNQAVELDKGFGTFTKDFLLDTSGISIWVKGSANNTDKLRFVLFEDNDSDYNLYETGDDIFEYTHNTVLSNSSWTKIIVPFRLFIPFAASGDGILQANHIGFLRLAIKSNSNTSHSATVRFDALQWWTSHQSPTITTAHINSTFIPLSVSNFNNFTVAQWESEMQRMKDVCIERIVLQYSQVYYGNSNYGHSYFTPCNRSYIQTTSNAINNLMIAAQNKNMKVVMGLYYDENQWFDNHSNYSLASFYDNLYTRLANTIDDSYALFGNNPSFEGWYITQEFDDAWWQDNTQKTLLARFFRRIGQHAKQTNANKQVWIAPFLYPAMPADKLAVWYNTFLDTVNVGGVRNIDKLYLQDGIGVNHHELGVDVPQYMTRIKAVCTNHNIDFGIVLESFLQSYNCPIDTFSNLLSCHETAPFNLRFKKQLIEAGAITNEIANFSWLDFKIGAACTGQSDSLYNGYLAYLRNQQGNCATTSAINEIDFQQKISIYPNPANTQLFITGKLPQNYEISILNLLGEKILNCENRAELQIESLAKGIYFLLIKENMQPLVVMKFVKE